MSSKKKFKRDTKNQKSLSGLFKLTIIIWVLVVVGAILLIKGIPLNQFMNRSQASFSSDLPGVALQIPRGSAIEGTDNSTDLPASKLKLAITNGQPTLVFFHSNSCDSCIQMIQIVNEVYPEFMENVVLVDVNVYDPQNEGLIDREGINFIPSLVFYDSSGNRQIHVGVMQSQELQTKLTEILQ